MLEYKNKIGIYLFGFVLLLTACGYSNISTESDYAPDIYNLITDDSGLSGEDKINFGMGIDSFRARKLDAAIEYLKRVYENNGDYFPVLYNLGTVYAVKGNLDTAIIYFEKAGKIQDDNVYVMLSLGVLYNGVHDFDKSVKILEKAIELAPNMSELYLFLGNSYFNLRIPVKAYKNYKKYIESNEAKRLPSNRITKLEQYIVHLMNLATGKAENYVAVESSSFIATENNFRIRYPEIWLATHVEDYGGGKLFILESETTNGQMTASIFYGSLDKLLGNEVNSFRYTEGNIKETIRKIADYFLSEFSNDVEKFRTTQTYFFKTKGDLIAYMVRGEYLLKNMDIQHQKMVVTFTSYIIDGRNWLAMAITCPERDYEFYKHDILELITSTTPLKKMPQPTAADKNNKIGIKTPGKSPDDYYKEAKKFLEEGQRVESVVALLEDGIKQYPRDNRLRLLLARVFLKENMPEEAIDILNHGLSYDPHNFHFWELQGDAYKLLLYIDNGSDREDFIEEARFCYREALRFAGLESDKKRILRKLNDLESQNPIGGRYNSNSTDENFIIGLIVILFVIMIVIKFIRAIFLWSRKRDVDIEKLAREDVLSRSKGLECLILSLTRDFKPSHDVEVIEEVKSLEQGFETINFSFLPSQFEDFITEISRRIRAIGDYTIDWDPDVYRVLDEKSATPIIHERRYARAVRRMVIEKNERRTGYLWVFLGIILFFIGLSGEGKPLLFALAGIISGIYGLLFYKKMIKYCVVHGIWIIIKSDIFATRNLCEGKILAGGEAIIYPKSNRKQVKRLAKGSEYYKKFDKSFDRLMSLLKQIISKYSPGKDTKSIDDKERRANGDAKGSKKGLPHRCPYCGGKVDPDNFNSRGEIVCPFCDSIL